ncbi:MAG: tetratricopeptide repeat protein [Myxococcota bacterium]
MTRGAPRLALLLLLAGAAHAGCASTSGARGDDDAVEPDTTVRGAPLPEPLANDLHREGLAALRAGDLERAGRLLLDAAEAAPGHAGVRVDLGVARLVAGAPDAALDAADAALAIAPEHPRALLLRAEASVALGQAQRGLDISRDLVDARPEWADAWYALGRAALTVGRRPEAGAAFEEVLDLRPGDRDAWKGLLAVASMAPDEPGWEEIEARVSSEQPDEAGVLVNRGAAAEIRERTDEARRLYRAAVEADPDCPWARYNLARLLDREGDPTAALPHYRAFLRVAPPGARQQVEEVRAVLKTHDPPEAP